MMHHPDQTWLEQYAAGALALPLALGVSVHLNYCGECRRQVELLQGLAAELMAQLEPQPVAAPLFEKILSAIDTAPAPTPAAESHTAVPKPLRRLVPRGYEALAWVRGTPGLLMAPLPLDDGGRYSIALHRVQPGGRVPRHDHGGQEITLVLSGTFSDELGVYSDGDFILREPTQQHEPVASRNEECLCLTIQEAPVKFTGFFWRWLNPFL